MSTTHRLSLAVVRSSLVWGALATLGFYAGVHSLEQAGGWQGEFAHRYFANHWVLYVETAMFFVGLSGLALKAFDVAGQAARVDQPLLGTMPSAALPATQAAALRQAIDALPATERDNYLPRRVREALDSVSRNGSADRLGEELRYLAELDADRQHASFGLLRIVIWAIPILGFLGTVIGITMAIASLSPEQLETSLPEVIGGLGVAFDTTALALALSMVLMFGQFAVDRRENALLAKVDARAANELIGRFQETGLAGDPRTAEMRRLGEAVLQATERVAQRQADIFQAALETANQRFVQLSAAAGEHLEQSLNAALGQNLQQLAENVSKSTEGVLARQLKNASQYQQSLAESTAAAKATQAELARHADVFMQIVQATGQLTRLEDTLNGNLAALAGAQHFQETMLNLAGAIHLLNARLGQIAGLSPHIEFKDASPLGKAA